MCSSDLNQVDHETLKLEKCQKSVLSFAAPLFRLALTAYLGLRWPTEIPSANEAALFGEFVGKRMEFRGPQRDCEAAILCADNVRQTGESGRADN